MIELEIIDDADFSIYNNIKNNHLRKTGHMILGNTKVVCPICLFFIEVDSQINKAFTKSIKITILDLSNYTNSPNPIKTMKNPKDITVPEAGYQYGLPVYGVTNDGIVDAGSITLSFCRGDKSDETKPRQEGIFVESLLTAIINRLQTVNTGLLATRETALAITKLEEGLMWLEKRSQDRKERDVEQTYKP